VSLLVGGPRIAPTPAQSIAMAYARLRALRDNIDTAEPYAPESLCTNFNRALDDLQSVGFDLSAFRLDLEERVADPNGLLQFASSVLRTRLDAILGYLDLLAGLP
jgi:signal transduction histidine kinase